MRRLSDLVPDEEKRIMDTLRKRAICPYLRNFGKYFYYCGQKVADNVEITLDEENPIVKARLQPETLDRSCFDKCRACPFYTGQYKPRKG